MDKIIVELMEGKIEGVIGQNFNGEKIFKFLGVPYAKPPINELRFKAPQPVEKWNGIKDATKEGNHPFQREASRMGSFQIYGSEDCLALNVFTRKIAPVGNLKPVMVYIYGGGFVMGSNSTDIYGPELLLMEDIVLVVMNYRLGLLGFLSLEDVSLDIPGNAGLKDQTLALKWVQRNIKVFGGDPNNVTIFGNSGGAASVHFHVLSKASKGLFHKAIMQSGDALAPWALTKPTDIAKAMGKKGATDREILGVLQNMTIDEIMAVQIKMPDPYFAQFARPIGPVVEQLNPSAFLTRHPFEIMTSGDYNHVPLFIGYTSEEGLYLEALPIFRPEFKKKLVYKMAIPWASETTEEQNVKIEEIMTNFYSKEKDPIDKHMVVMDCCQFSTNVAAIIHHVKTSKCPIYVYRVSSIDCQRNYLKQKYNLHQFKGTCHADELGFLWNMQFLPKIQPNSLENLLVHTFVRLWTNFAAFGNPTYNNTEVNLSPVKETNNITLLNIGKDLKILKDLPERERLELWKKIYSFGQKTANYLKD